MDPETSSLTKQLHGARQPHGGFEPVVVRTHVGLGGKAMADVKAMADSAVHTRDDDRRRLDLNQHSRIDPAQCWLRPSTNSTRRALAGVATSGLK